ncbi:hypothetical protein [Actinokineospora alba]|nr:hypothetical protein [Actinokineospora alba]
MVTNTLPPVSFRFGGGGGRRVDGRGGRDRGGGVARSAIRSVGAE